MEVDTGASASIISESVYRKLWPMQPSLQPSTVKLRTYTGEELKVLGSLPVEVDYHSQKASLHLLVVAGSGPSLLGRDWLAKLRLDWQNLHRLHTTPQEHQLQDVLSRYADVFKEELGLVKQTAKIYVDPTAKPRFCKPRTVPYAIRAKVEQELDRLEKSGIIEKMQFSSWAAPIVPVLKRDGSVRICGDYRATVNQAAKLDTYPLPRIEDLFASLTGGKTFSKLDLSHAYQQIPLDEESKSLVAINTHKGLYKYHRLPFGVASAPSIFQRIMEGILNGISHVCVYIDDILVTGSSEAEHLSTLEEVLRRLRDAGLRLKRTKCTFMLPTVEYLGHSISAEGLRPTQETVEYLGHSISAEGLRPTQEKVRAIVEAPAPQNVSQLRSFLGLVNYYGKFLPNLSSTLAPLHRLLRKHTRWLWSSSEEEAFQAAKKQLIAPCLLMHYDPKREVTLACDASPYGIGAVLSQVTADGTEKPVAFASRSLSPAEKKYAQVEKEGLAIVFGVKKFNQYLFGRKFTIYSDHKPLQHLFSESRPVPAMASSRIQRWALTLSAYDYTMCYKPGNQQSHADSLSRLPLPEAPSNVPLPEEIICMMENLQGTPVDAVQIRRWTDRDPLLARVRELVLHGWMDNNDPDLTPFNRRKTELSVEEGCVLWGSRVVVPHIGRGMVMEELHSGHPGITRMKGIARRIVWWPGIDQDLENCVKSCTQCQLNQSSPARAPLHPWEWPQRPWARIHIDHAGPFLGHMFLIVIDAHSKWLSVDIVPSTSSQTTIKKLRAIFATHGIPEVLVSDNGSGFTSSEFKEFLNRNGIRHLTTAPYHPSSNGMAERAVQVFKEGMKKSTSGDLETRLSRFLFHYRTTPHSTTGVSPAELLMGRQLRSQLDLLQPSIATRVQRRQEKQKAEYDQHAKQRSLSPNDPVFVRNFASGAKWLPGIVTELHGPLMLKVQLQDGPIVCRHLDHVRYRYGEESSSEEDDDPLPSPKVLSGTNVPQPTSPIIPRRSGRNRKPPTRLIQDPVFN